MKTIVVSTQGFELNYSVPESVEEYNRLAPKRTNPVLEDAIWSTLYRNVFNKFRDKNCDALEKLTDVARINHGTEDEPKWETDNKYLKRVIATVAAARGLDPAAKATRDLLIAEWTPGAQSIINGIPFDPSEREGGTGPGLAKQYIAWATQAVTGADGGTKLLGLLNKVLNSNNALTGVAEQDIELLAKMVAANEKRKRDLIAAQSKAEYGVE